MRDFFGRMALRMAQFMQGRYGADSLSNGLAAVGIISLLLSIVPFLDFFSWIALIALLTAVARSLSRNFAQRQRENEAYERVISKPRRMYHLAKKAWANRATTKYFRCKHCGQVLSIPRGKGTLRVVCPKCKTEVQKKS